jgi:hypothetical protein
MGASRPNQNHANDAPGMQGSRDPWGRPIFQGSGRGDMPPRSVSNQGMQGQGQGQGQEQASLQSTHQPPMMQAQKPTVVEQQQQQQQQQHQQQQHQQQQQQQQQQRQENPAIEFDHAITYVTTIKKRFGDEPRTYQHFLEILHTYQKEQRGIREVLEQVSSLFADHPDLLKQFTYFLPEAVQEQAKERLHAAAAEAEERQAAARKRAAEASNQYDSENKQDGQGDGQEISFDLTQKVCFVYEWIVMFLAFGTLDSFHSILVLR